MAYRVRFIDKSWFQEKLGARGLQQKQLADEIGMRASALSLILSGRRRAQIGEAASIASALRVPIRDVLSALGIDYEPTGDGSMKVGGFVGAGDVVSLLDEDHPDFGAYEVHVPFIPFGDIVILLFETSDFAPRYLAGEHVAYVRVGNPSTAIGADVVAQIQGGPMVMKRLQRGSERDRYVLLSLSPSQAPMVNVEVAWASPILWHLPVRRIG